MQNGVRLRVNGIAHDLAVPPETILLYVLRNDLALNSPKYGCGLGECGSCTVLVDGVPARSCVVPAGIVQGCEITTLEGLGTAASLHPVQRAFIAAQAAQCGFCLNGMIMSAHALLAKNPAPDEAEMREALRYNLCRCGAHYEILAAIRLAVSLLAEARAA
jgi:nicotinate dehydrogenase subunit A